MSPTGSTSEQKSPTKWQRRLMLTLGVGMLLLLATSASAGWGTRSVPGTPNDVRIWAPRVFSVATDAGAWLERADGTTVFINTPGMAQGTYHRPSTNCFLAIQRNGEELGTGICSGTGLIERADKVRVRTAGTSAFLLLDYLETPRESRLYKASNPGVAPWALIDQSIDGDASNLLAVLDMNGSEHVLLGTKQPNADGKLYWYRDGAEIASYDVRSADGDPVARDSEAVDLFPAGGSTPAALFSWRNTLYRGVLGDGGTPFNVVSHPGGPGTVTALDVNTGAGTQHGDGFGMAAVQNDGGVTLLSAVPKARPEDIGTEWRVNPTLPAGLTAPRALECHGASFCVIAQASPTANNVFVYTNDAPPELMVGSSAPDPFNLPSGTSRTINVRAPDPDGDAVLVRVVPSSLSRDGLTMTTSAADGGVDLVLGAGTVCSNIREAIAISTTDGLDSHAMTGNFLLQVQRAAAPGEPSISPSANNSVPAGSGPLTLTADAIAPCGIREFTWTPLSPDARALTLSGLRKEQAVFLPPETLCKPLGETHLYRVQAVEDGGVSSPPTDVTIQVLPWGAPRAPFEGGHAVTLRAGNSVSGRTELRPTATHVCEPLGVGFPGVDTLWQLASGEPAPPGVRLRADGGTPITGSSAVTPVLIIETDECIQTAFNLTVQHYTRGAFGSGGPESNVQVTVVPDLNPPSDATMQLTTLFQSAESAAGTSSVSGLDCPELREDLELQARIFLARDGATVREGIFPVPGSWQFTLGEACLGATYELKGELLVDGGVVVAGEPITVGALTRPVLQPMEAPFLTARCGEPAMGVLEQRALQPCAELPISWRQVDGGGVTLTEPTYTGQRIEVVTRETDFGELIGQSVRMSMSATTIDTEYLEQDVPILTEPFVELRRRTEKATGTDVDLAGVSVELRNTTECGVRQVDHQERLEGADYVPGSARFNGAPVEAGMEGDTLTVRGLVLEGSATGRLTYVVRPRLLESARFEGQAFVRGVPVSRPQEDPPSGCGCSGSGSGLAALGLAGLAMALRRRRRQ